MTEMDIASFNLNLLRTLDAVLDERSVSAAATRLGLSQPAVSASLTRLRSALGDRLLIRRGNRLEPTALAESLQPRVRRILEDVQRVLTAFEEFDHHRDVRRFRVAATDYASFVILMPLVIKLRDEAPRVTVDIVTLDDRIETNLANGQCDLALGGAAWVRRSRSREILFTEPYVSVARRHHPRLSSVVTLAQFVAEQHVLVSLHGQTSGIVDSALSKIGRTRAVGLVVPNFLLAPFAVSESDMILTVGSRIAHAFKDMLDLRVFKTPVNVRPYGVPMTSHVRTQGDPAVEWLKASIRDFVHAFS